jgi:hypothetical protein
MSSFEPTDGMVAGRHRVAIGPPRAVYAAQTKGRERPLAAALSHYGDSGIEIVVEPGGCNSHHLQVRGR